MGEPPANLKFTMKKPMKSSRASSASSLYRALWKVASAAVVTLDSITGGSPPPFEVSVAAADEVRRRLEALPANLRAAAPHGWKRRPEPR